MKRLGDGTAKCECRKIKGWMGISAGMLPPGKVESWKHGSPVVHLLSPCPVPISVGGEKRSILGSSYLGCIRIWVSPI